MWQVHMVEYYTVIKKIMCHICVYWNNLKQFPQYTKWEKWLQKNNKDLFSYEKNTLNS